MRERGRRRAHRREHLKLERGVRHMVLAAHDMGDAQIHVVDRARQHVEPRSVGAADHRVAHRRRVELLGAADQVVPRDRRVMVEPEPPVRSHALRLQPRPLGIVQRQRRPVVDRRQPAPEQHLAPEVELLRALIGGIDAPRRDQPGKARLVEIEPLGLPHLGVGGQPEPRQVASDRVDEPLLAALRVGVVDAQHEASAGLPRPQPIVQRCADVADVEHGRWATARSG